MVFTVRMQAHLDRGTPEQYAGGITEMLDRLGMANFPAMYLAAPGRALLAAGDAGPARTALRAFLTGPAERDAQGRGVAGVALGAGRHRAAPGQPAEAVAKLFEALRPHESLWAVDGLGAVVFGTIAEQLGRARPTSAGRTRPAGIWPRHGNGTCGPARPALRDRVDALSPDPPQHAARPGLRAVTGRSGSSSGTAARSTVPDSKGVRDLAVLLSRPGQVLPAFDLVEAAGGPPAAAAAAQAESGRSWMTPHGARTVPAGGTGR